MQITIGVSSSVDFLKVSFVATGGSLIGAIEIINIAVSHNVGVPLSQTL